MEASLPPDLVDRMRALETRVENMERAQRPDAPGLFGLADVAGLPATSGQTLEYDRASGTWKPSMILSPGDVKFTTSNVAPAGRWILANGTAVSRTTYALLFAEIGTTYGTGNGSTTFNLPNLQSRMVIGVGTDSLGTTGGARTHALSTAEMPSHNHGPVNGGQFVTTASGGTAYDVETGTFYGFKGNSATASAGSGSAHNNMPPFLALWGYIRY